jgi:uncharacterized protein YcgI (DUF1989 family)
METLRDETAPRNTGWGAEMAAGQILRLSARTIIDFVCFDARDFAEAFDQAPTKAASNCLYLRAGDVMMSRGGLPLMTMLEDGFAGLGTHDMQFGMCGRARHRRAAAEGRLGEYLNANVQVPDHGCAENLTEACKPWGIPYEDIPSPVNLFQNMAIEQATGRMSRTQIRPAAPVPVVLRAERDLIVAFSACPDLASATGGLEVRAEILRP